MVDGLPIESQAGRAIEHRSRPEGLLPGFAESGSLPVAEEAASTAGGPAQDDLATRFQGGDSRARGFDNPRALVSCHSREGVFRRACADIPVAVTDAGGANLDQNLSLCRRGKLEGLDLERLSRSRDDGRLYFHRCLLPEEF